MAIMSTVSKKDVNARTAQLVDMLEELGPDIPEISRRLGQFKESVRYRYKEKILNKGLAVQGIVDDKKFGLDRIIMVASFENEYQPFAAAILTAMNELCYLVNFGKVLPGGQYVGHLSVPSGLKQDVKGFLMDLKDKGMFSRLEVLESDWLLRAPMRSDCYDFDTGRWEYDWSNPQTRSFESASRQASTPSKFDYTDLLLVKEFQMDANKSLKEISERLELNYKKVAWHFNTHVRARHMLRGYSLRWIGTKYDYGVDKALHRQHKYFAMSLLVKDVNDYELVSLRQEVNKVPFLWSEAIGRTYFAEFAFPLDYVVEGMQWLSKLIVPVKGRSELFTMDQTASLGFTIPYTLYDQTLKRWRLEPADLARRFDSLIMQIKTGGGWKT